jgi:tRNA-dihydrouridine synthase A
VAQCVRALKQTTWLPVTVKARIGIDHLDSYDDLCRFVEPVAQAGCEVFIIHARKAWLRGLSPKQNREIPPLRYEVVRRLKAEHPHLSVVINGGIQCLDEAKAHLRHVDGVMLGRAAYRNPYLLSEVDQRLYGESSTPVSRHEAVQAMYPYIRRELSRGTPLMAIVRHMLGLFQGVRGAKAFRRHLSENGPRAGAGLSVLQEALAKVPAESAENRLVTTDQAAGAG